MHQDAPCRCPWAQKTPLEQGYHDTEWGVPVTDDQVQFEFLVLESFQSGLSWAVVLSKREGFRNAFGGFQPAVVARYGQNDVERLVADASIIRNRRKIEAAIKNARAFLQVQAGFGSFSSYIWSFVGGQPITNRWDRMEQVPATSPQSTALAKDMKARGFSFVGPTVAYAHMQATGLVNDHLAGCFRHAGCAALAERVVLP